jgi:hypothetical protein
MNNDDAKKTLALYRPGTEDRTDPSFNEAIAQAKPQPPGRWQDKANPELSRWFQEHCSSYLSIRTKFLNIPTPPDLKARILAEGKTAQTKVIPFRFIPLLRAAAVIVLCVSLAALFWRSHGRKDDFDTYRSRMTRTALQPYAMDFHSHNLQFINAFFAEHKAPADYVLPEGVSKAQPVGCAVLRWQGEPVSMICFHSGQPLAAGEKTDLWFFVIDQSSMRDGPAARAPAVARVMKLMTAAWSQDGKTYVLAASGDEEFLRKYL